ncbi:MAG: alkaline phosphatase family protein, partial [Chloroflexi bacterium]
VFIQIDGLAHPILEDHLRAGRTPNLARWLSSGDMTLDRWKPLLPTQTSASQAGVLHGNNDGIPGFRWWDKKTQRLMVSNHPKDAHEIMQRVSNGDGLLAHSGASIGNLLSGDAARSFLTAATLDDPAKEIRRSHVLDWFFISPYSYVRWTLLSIGEVIKELVQARAAARSGLSEPRGFPYPLARAATNVLLRHLSTALVIEEMWRRSSPIYVDFVDYDEIAHHSGPDRVEARDAVAGLDKIIGIIERAAADAPRPYRFVVLSDHGQSPGAMFAQRYRKSLEGLVQDLAGEHVKVQGATAHVEHWGRISPLLSEASGITGMPRTVTSAPFRRHAGATDDAEKPSDIVVAASGNLVQLSFPGMPGRATSEPGPHRWDRSPSGDRPGHGPSQRARRDRPRRRRHP